MKIFNTAVYGLEESIVRSGYPMLTEIPDDLFLWGLWDAEQPHRVKPEEEYQKHVRRAVKLANAGAGHNNFLKSVIVQMDVEAPQYVWMQIERYQFFTIISSQSKMHRLLQMDLKGQFLDGCFDSTSYNNIKGWIELYKQEKCDLEDVLNNVPMGLELAAGISTNYLCLQNMIKQRRDHRLKFWNTVFVDWCKTLPMSRELIFCEN